MPSPTVVDLAQGPPLLNKQLWVPGTELRYSRHLADFKDSLDAVSYLVGDLDRATFTPTPNSLLTLIVAGTKLTDGNFEMASVSDSGMDLDWKPVLVRGDLQDTHFYRVYVYTAQVGPDPVATTVTVTWNQTVLSHASSIDEFTGHNPVVPIRANFVAQLNASGVDAAATLPKAPLSDSIVVVAAVGRRNNPGLGFTATGAWAKTFDNGVSTPPTSLPVWYTSPFSPPQQSFASTGTDLSNITVAFEVQSASQVPDQPQYAGPVRTPGLHLEGDQGPPILLSQYVEPDVGTPAAPATTVTVDVPGAITFTGQTVNLINTVAVTPGAVTLTGQSVNLVTTVPVAPGAVTFTGQTVLLRNTVAVSPGAVTFAGATVNLANTIAVTPGAVTFTGQTILLRNTVAVSPGAVTFAGATVNLANTVAVTPGAVTFTGQTVLLRNTVVVSPGAVTYSGQTVNLITGSILTVTPGALTLTGQTVLLRTNLVVEPGALTFSGQAVNLILPVEPEPEPEPPINRSEVYHPPPSGRRIRVQGRRPRF